jgi:hypothetical protein
LALVCGDGAEIVFRDPWITVLENGAGSRAPFRARENPVGLEESVSDTVLGSS